MSKKYERGGGTSRCCTSPFMTTTDKPLVFYNNRQYDRSVADYLLCK